MRALRLPLRRFSALRVAAEGLREAVKGREATRQVVLEADRAVERAQVVAKLRRELRDAQETLEVRFRGQPLTERSTVSFQAPTCLEGSRRITLALPNVEDVRGFFTERGGVVKAEEMAEVLEKFLKDFVEKAPEHVAMLTAWGPKAIADSEGEFGEVAALMRLQLKAFQATIESSKKDFHFELARSGENRDCLVMPPSNFALLGLKDAFHMLLKGFRVLLLVQPRFYPHFQVIKESLSSCGLADGMLEVLPGITPEADPNVLHEALRHVHRLQFTGSSTMCLDLSEGSRPA